MYNVAIIVAAGSGTRMKINKSKLLIELSGKTVIERTVDAFDSLPQINEIIIACRECDIEEFSALIPSEKVTFIIGGKTRQESVKNAISSVDECDYVLIHDGARPLVDKKTILDTLDKAIDSKAAATGVMVKDTIKVIDNENVIVSTPERSSLVSIQTPQVFDFSTYKNALEKAELEEKNYTDDCQLLENFGVKVSVVLGSYENIKITTADDVPLAESILKLREEK